MAAMPEQEWCSHLRQSPDDCVSCDVVRASGMKARQCPYCGHWFYWSESLVSRGRGKPRLCSKCDTETHGKKS